MTLEELVEWVETIPAGSTIFLYEVQVILPGAEDDRQLELPFDSPTEEDTHE